MSSVTGKIGECLTAVTHDSDPRELRLQLLSRIDGSIVTDEYSGPPPIPLSLADDGSTPVTPVVPAALIGDILGGDGADLTISAILLGQDIIPVTALLTGTITLRVFCDDSTQFDFPFTFAGVASDLNQYLGGLPETSTDLFSNMGPYLSSSDLVGKTVNNCVAIVSGGFSGTHVVPFGACSLDQLLSSFEIGIGGTGTTDISTCPIRVTGQHLNDGTKPGAVPGGYSPADDDQIYLRIITKATVQGVWDVNVDGSTIVANATAPQKLTQSATIDIINLNDLTPSILGWRIVSVLNQVPNVFTATPGRAFSDAALLPIINLTELGTHYCLPSQMTLIGDVNKAFSPPLPGVPADSVLSLLVNIYNGPTPAVYAPGLYTEPYEIRNRNLPAMRGYCDGNMTEDDYLIEFQASQDGLTWFRVPMTYIDVVTALQAAGSMDSWRQVLPVSVYAPRQAPNVHGWVAILSKEFTGPWNYLRAYLTVTADAATRLSDTYFHMIANAREL